MSLLDEMQQRRDEINALAEKYGVMNVRVFGSVARQEERADSDVDLLIGLKSPVENGLACFSFQIEMEKMFGRKVDMLFETGLFHVNKHHILSESRPI